MDGGHSGSSGRYARYKETAFKFVFLVSLVGTIQQGEPNG